MSLSADRRRHAPVARSRASRLDDRHRGLSNVYLGRGRRTAADIYAADHHDGRHSHRFRWVLSTCLAAMVGVVAIGVVIFGSLGDGDNEGGPSVLARIRQTQFSAPRFGPRAGEGLKWATPKSDRLQVMGASQSAKQIIHEQIQVRRDNRPFIQIRPYVRITARLQPAPATNTDVIPPFNPSALYAGDTARGAAVAGTQAARGEVAIQILDLPGGLLPIEDQQEIDLQAALDLIARSEETSDNAERGGFQARGLDAFAQAVGDRADAQAPNTTILPKTVVDDDDSDDTGTSDAKIFHASRGDTLSHMLAAVGTDANIAAQIVASAKSIFPDHAMQPGYEVQVTFGSALPGEKADPTRISVFDQNHEHKVTITRNSTADYSASPTPIETKALRSTVADGQKPQNSSLYSALYNAALTMGIPSEVIQQVLRVHVFDTDFKRRVSQGDLAEFFFDLKDESNPDGALGELLYTALNVGGELHKFWRFRTPDGVVDYYDESGNNSKKFLMRRPVRGDSVHFTSGFGIRFHPVLRISRPHNGIDWAGPVGVPIVAAGNGVIEFIGRRGEFGNHIEIRHANGYETTYSHMVRFETGMAENVKVRQGQVIGYIGATGLVSGPHLHFEVKLNGRYVDPLTIEVPNERKLAGRQLADFQKERARIDDLMRRAPVNSEIR